MYTGECRYPKSSEEGTRSGAEVTGEGTGIPVVTEQFGDELGVIAIGALLIQGIVGEQAL